MTITQDIIKIDDNKINIIYENDILWAKAKDICNYLLYKNSMCAINTLLINCDIKQQGNFYKKCTGNTKATKYINKTSITILLIKSKQLPEKIIKIANAFDIKLTILDPIQQNCLNIKILSKEQQTLNNIMQSFNGETFLLQHTICNYRIDLYMPKYKLAIECDEFDHCDRDKDHEQIRETFIKNKLKCTFIRFNPDATNFNIFEVINKIFIHIKSHQHCIK